MPKGFSEREKALIRAAFSAKGRELFSMHGLAKTNIADLSRAAGVSKGAFYLFYDSKEALFFDLLEQFEASYKAAMLQAIADQQLTPAERMRTLLRDAIAVLHSAPLFAQFSGEEYERLARKLPPERLHAHLQADQTFAAEFIATWQSVGVEIRVSPELLTGLLRALFVLAMHKKDIGSSVHTQVIEASIDMLASYLM